MTSPRSAYALAFLLMGVAACTPSPEAVPAETGEAAGVSPAETPPSPAAAGESPTAQAPGAPAASGRAAQVLEGIPSKIPMPAKDVETPPIADGAEVTYVCESGMPLRIGFDGMWAHVAWTDGRRLRLSKTANPSGTGERYAGEGYVLNRVANVVELTLQEGGRQWRCAEGAANA